MNYHSDSVSVTVTVTVPATSGAGVLPTATPSTASPVRVLILGHSFVKHLRNHLVASDFLNFGLLPTGHRVTLRGFSGLTYPGLLKQLKSVCAPGYQVVLLEFGTNDVAAACCRTVGRHGLVSSGNSPFLLWCPTGGTYGNFSSCCRTVPLCARL